MKFNILIIVLFFTCSPSFAQEGQIEGQIDLSPLLNEYSSPLSDNTPQILRNETEKLRLEVLPNYFRTDGRMISKLAQPEAEKLTSYSPLLPITVMGSHIHRLSGEYDEINIDLEVPQDGTKNDLVITYRNSINVLKENSTITVFREGMKIGSWRPNAPANFQQVTLPADTLTPGLNRILIRVEQSHRIFCGPEASFAIWTDIDLALSGVERKSSHGQPNMDYFRRAVSAQIETYGTIPLVTAFVPAPSLMRNLEQRIAAMGPKGPKRLSVQSPYKVAHEAVQSMEFARIALTKTSNISDEGSLPVVHQSPQGSLILVITDNTTVDMLDGLLPKPTIISAPTNLIPGQNTTIKSLNTDGIVIRSRYKSIDIPFRLPDDWLVLNSQRAQIDLQFRYAENLPQGALLMIKVNGTTVRLLPLFRDGGVERPKLVVGFLARLLKPGYNAISFESFIPSNFPNLACPTNEGPLLEISGNTAVKVPTSPRMQFPSVSHSLHRITPESLKLSTYLNGDPHNEEIFTMLEVHLAGLDVKPPSTDIANLTIITPDLINQEQLNMLSLDRSQLEAALIPQITELKDQILDITANLDPFKQPTVSFTSKISGGIKSTWQWLRSLAFPSGPSLTNWLAGQHGQALLLIPDLTAPLDLWLIVSASTDADDVARALAAGRLDPFGPDGRASLLSSDGVWKNWYSNTGAPRLLEPLTLVNARSIASNYASWSPGWFIGLMFGFMSLSVILGLSFVVNTRGTRKK